LNFYKRVTQHKPPFRNAFSVRYPERKGRFKVKEAAVLPDKLVKRREWGNLFRGEGPMQAKDQD